MVARRAHWFAAGRPAFADRPAAFLFMRHDGGLIMGNRRRNVQFDVHAALKRPQWDQPHAGEIG